MTTLKELTEKASKMTREEAIRLFNETEPVFLTKAIEEEQEYMKNAKKLKAVIHFYSQENWNDESFEPSDDNAVKTEEKECSSLEEAEEFLDQFFDQNDGDFFTHEDGNDYVVEGNIVVLE